MRANALSPLSGDANAFRAEPRIGDASYGLMQILYGTAQKLGYIGDPDGLYDPATNIHWAVMLMAENRARYGNDFSRNYSAYNSGNPDKYKTSVQVAQNVARALQNLAGHSACLHEQALKFRTISHEATFSSEVRKDVDCGQSTLKS